MLNAERQTRANEIDRQPEANAPDAALRTLFDEGFPKSERLLRRMDVFIGSKPEDPKVATMLVNGIKTGDDLRDNRYQDDGYRFHDVFHIAYAATLGWSPTIRALMRRKRKSVPIVDEVEDGGRAIAIEEGIIAMTFSYAERRNFLEGEISIDARILRIIKDMTAHLEVSRRTEAEWEKAILAGFNVWRSIRANGKGRIQADLEAGALSLAA